MKLNDLLENENTEAPLFRMLALDIKKTINALMHETGLSMEEATEKVLQFLYHYNPRA